MKSKLKFSLVLFTLIYGVFKIVQFTGYLNRIFNVILNDDCEEPCVVEYFEMAFIACVFIPLSALIYGVIKVNSSDKRFRSTSYMNVSLQQLKQSYVGLWLVVHTILLGFDCFVQYDLRFGANSSEFRNETIIRKSTEFGKF